MLKSHWIFKSMPIKLFWIKRTGGKEDREKMGGRKENHRVRHVVRF